MHIVHLAKIQGRVAEIKASEEVGVKFMQRWEEEALIRHESKQEGIKEGIKEGISLGEKQGGEKERLSSIRNIMDSMKLTAEEAMKALKIPESDFEKYMTKL